MALFIAPLDWNSKRRVCNWRLARRAMRKSREATNCRRNVRGNVSLCLLYFLLADVIHTVGPIGENTSALSSCYRTSLTQAVENKCRSVVRVEISKEDLKAFQAFPCISTGIYGYPNEPACKVALGTVQKFLQERNNAESIDRVIFCLFLPVDVELYHKHLPEYFPI